jgi:hypothetical protein
MKGSFVEATLCALHASTVDGTGVLHSACVRGWPVLISDGRLTSLYVYVSFCT